MPRKELAVTVSDSDLDQIASLLKKESLAPRVHQRCQILQWCGKKSNASIAELLCITTETVRTTKKKYLSEGLSGALYDKSRSGRPREIDGAQRARITSIACSTPPEGYARWTVRLLADRVVELQIVEKICFKSVHEILKKTNSSRT